jgi:hypothetical protein
MIGARHQRGLVANPRERSDQREQVSAIHVIPRGALVLSADKELGTCCAPLAQQSGRGRTSSRIVRLHCPRYLDIGQKVR